MGAWQSVSVAALFAGLGILVGIAYTWRAMQKAFFADAVAVADLHPDPVSGITLPERAGALILLASTVAAGLFPQVLLNLIIPALHSPLFDGLRKGSWR